ncbi:MAG: VTT domain-containing protein [Thermoanaerobaculia bacterium]
MTRAHGRLALRLLVLGAIVAAVVALYLSPWRGMLTVENIRLTAGRIAGFWYAPLLFIVAYAVGCVLWVPATVFVLSAGVIWGWQLGGIYALTGATIGATASFLVARFIGGGILLHMGENGRRVSRQLDHAGFKSFLLLRVIPIFPFAVLNYGAGFAGLRLTHFVLGTVLGIAPITFVMTYSSDALLNGTLTRDAFLHRVVTVFVLMLLAVGVPMLLKRRATQRLAADDPVVPDSSGQ